MLYVCKDIYRLFIEIISYCKFGDIFKYKKKLITFKMFVSVVVIEMNSFVATKLSDVEVQS